MKIFVLIFFGLIAASFANDITDTFSSYSEFSSISGIDERTSGGIAMNFDDLIEFNYQVGLFIQNRDHSRSICGGALIHPEVVLTAAHCLTNAYMVGVFGGTLVTPRSIYARDGSIVIAGSKQLKIHEDYNPGSPEDDIAIIMLQKPIHSNNSSYIGVIPLAKDNSQCESGKAWVSGWGRTDDENDDMFASVLNFKNVEPITYDECKKYTDELVPEKFLCTSGKESQGTCKGYSGGPYAIEDDNGERCLCGVNAFHISMNCASDLPRVKTSVPHYCKNGWICKTSRKKVGCH